MTKNIYALLVGIDEYHPESPINRLSGCVNDIDVIDTYLEKRVEKDKFKLHKKRLINKQATRQNIIDNFQQHLTQANSEDIVLYYYSGHGSYEPSPEIFSHDSQLETFVCYDSRANGVLDLANKELSYLIEQVAQKNPHILIILDSCHSGTATRDPDVTERQERSTGVARDLKDFEFDEAWAIRSQSSNYSLPKHIAIAACREHQKAKEFTSLENKKRGAFSYFLTEALHRSGSLSYIDLVREINALIIGKFPEQSPQIEIIGEPESGKLAFLGGAIGDRANYFNLYYDSQKHKSWMIDGGVLHGIRPPSEGDTILAIYPKNQSEQLITASNSTLTTAKVSQVMTERSQVELIGNNTDLSEETAYHAVIIEVPLPDLKVYFTGDSDGIKLAEDINKRQPSLYLQKVDSLEKANYYLEANNNQYWIKQVADKRTLAAPIPERQNRAGYSSQDAGLAIKRLEHIARWQNILNLKTPPNSLINPSDIKMEITIISGNNKESSKVVTTNIIAEYTFDSRGNKERPRFEVLVTNNTSQDLHFHILEISESYAVNVTHFFEEKSSLLLKAGDSISSIKPKQFGISTKYVNQGITEYNSVFKLIASTREFNAILLEQDGLNPPPLSVNRSAENHGTLNRLMNRVFTREPFEDEEEYIDKWMTKEIKVTYIIPPNGVEIQKSGDTDIISGVKLQSHSDFQGRFSLKPLPPTSRGTDSNLVPPTLVSSLNLYQFNATTRDGSEASCVLEITDSTNYESITPENPLKILVKNSEGLLRANEYLLITGYDGEFFLPVGKSKTENNITEITIERLPAPTVDSRSLQSSIKLLFQKLIYKAIGKQFNYPLLRSVTFTSDGKPKYEDKEIKVKVEQSQKILLFIHGIIGDTESLVPSVRLAKFIDNEQEKTLRDKYDLILAFDYENLHTTIEENAVFLKQRLEEIGLGANHNKQLHIVAHSMGGLISRTFIEKEGGNKVVQHLVMLGTPNAGSPWPSIQDWAFMCLGIGLNQLSTITWPANIFAALLTFLEANDNALDQMNPQNSFIINLATNPDPNVQYTIIAGDRSIKKSTDPAELAEKKSQITRLLQQLFRSRVDSMLNTVSNLVFDEANDIAATLLSIKSVNLSHNPQPIIISPDAACDHLTYFSSPAGLDALIKALSD